jgi:hypothetical protein
MTSSRQEFRCHLLYLEEQAPPAVLPSQSTQLTYVLSMNWGATPEKGAYSLGLAAVVEAVAGDLDIAQRGSGSILDRFGSGGACAAETAEAVVADGDQAVARDQVCTHSTRARSASGRIRGRTIHRRPGRPDSCCREIGGDWGYQYLQAAALSERLS